jgi:hypothetical protein
VRLMRIVDGIQMCIRSRIRDCQRNRNGPASAYYIIYEIVPSAEGGFGIQAICTELQRYYVLP